ncbi:hypothetical protein [Terrabacter sp. NPDC000476]|uniref:DUF6414 family protein n=1 Tax=Terrabacter sp. NPDC000476 TaxID=3154258 RepID=UPI003330C2A8
MTKIEASQIAHPVYLDDPMMLSFLAHLEGGVSVEQEETARETGARERGAKARAGAKARMWGVADATIDAEGSTNRRDETALESKSTKHHTAASLFNLLYYYLKEDSKLRPVDTSADLEALAPGEIVEIRGEYLGNPLEDALAFLSSILPYLMEQQHAQREAAEAALRQAKPRSAARSGNPARKGAGTDNSSEIMDAVAAAIATASSSDDLGMKMLLRMWDDISSAPMHDLLFRTGGGLNTVVAVSSNFFSAHTKEYLRAGEFSIVGKVTRVIPLGQEVNLARRTVLGVAGPSTARELLDGLKTDEFHLDLADPIVAGPAVQILPMAIFI